MSKKYYRKADQEGNEYFVEKPSGAERVQGCGQAMESCGCWLIIFVTIPFFLLLFL